MASLPVFCDVEVQALRLSIPLTPQAGDPYTFVASGTNAALAIAALREDVDPDSTLVEAMSDLTLSPMYLLAKCSLERDLAELDRTQPADAADRRSFVLDIFAARLFLAGTKLREVNRG